MVITWKWTQQQTHGGYATYDANEELTDGRTKCLRIGPLRADYFLIVPGLRKSLERSMPNSLRCVFCNLIFLFPPFLPLPFFWIFAVDESAATVDVVFIPAVVGNIRLVSYADSAFG